MANISPHHHRGALTWPKRNESGSYLRVSTTGQTVENQRQDILRVAEQRGWQIVNEYVDHGISGSKGREERPGFKKLTKDAAAGKLDMLAAWSMTVSVPACNI